MFKSRFFIILIFFLASCATPVIKYYQPVMLGTASYMPKPSSFDSLKVSNYISGGYVQVLPPSATNKSDLEDIVNMAQLAINRAHRFKNINLAFGIDGFAGSYHNTFLKSDDPDYFKNKSVYSFQLKTSINTFKTSTYYDFRFIGVDLAYSKEYGSFSKFRKDISGRENFYTIPETGLFTAGISSEILFRSRKSSQTQYGCKLSVYNTFGNLHYQGFDPNGGKESSVGASMAFYLQLKKYFAILEGSKAARINVGYRF